MSFEDRKWDLKHKGYLKYMWKPINVDGEQILESKVEILISVNLIIYRYFDEIMHLITCTVHVKRYKVRYEKYKI